MRSLVRAGMLLVPALCTSALAGEADATEGWRIHSVTDISHEFTFYFDGRFAKNYIEPIGGTDRRNWGTLHRYDLERANLLVLQSGASSCPYLPEDIATVRDFLDSGGGVAVLGDHALFRREKTYRLNELVGHFGAEFSEAPARNPISADPVLERVESGLTTHGGKTLRLCSSPRWTVLVRDAENRPIMARRRVGKGALLVASRALAGRKPDASDPINSALWQHLLRDISRGKAVDPDLRPRHQMPELELEREGLRIQCSEYLKPLADSIFSVFKKSRPVLEKLLGVPPHEGMLANLILLPTGGGGFSSGRSIGLGVWWGGFPETKYGMVELLGHEGTHSWVLPFAEPMWNEGLATYVGILLARELGYEREANRTLERWIDQARRHDPEMTRFDLAGGESVPHAVRMAKPMWIWEELRERQPDLLARYFRAKRRLIDPSARQRYTPDDAVAVLSVAMNRDLFGWFRSLGVLVERGQTDISLKPTESP